jgi:hypothetical protein
MTTMILKEKKMRQEGKECSLTRQLEVKTTFTNKKPQLLTYRDFQSNKKRYFIYYLVKICLRLRQGRLAAFGLFLCNTESMLPHFYTLLIRKKYVAEGLQKFAINVSWNAAPRGV